jgi:hypothetical protein
MTMTFGVGKVLATGFRMWARSFVPFMFITGLFHLPVVTWNVLAMSGLFRLDGLSTQRVYSHYATMLLDVVLSAALTYGVVMELQGQRAPIRTCIATGIARFFPALGVAIVVAIVTIGPSYLSVRAASVSGGTIVLIAGGIVSVASTASSTSRPRARCSNARASRARCGAASR